MCIFAYPPQALQGNILGPRTKVKLSMCVLGEETQRAVYIYNVICNSVITPSKKFSPEGVKSLKGSNINLKHSLTVVIQ